MYNRYIPQSDGSFRRSPVTDQRIDGNQQIHNNHPAGEKSNTSTIPDPPQNHSTGHRPPRQEPVEHFLRNLLPQNFDTGDLLVVLLLLLMSADCKEEQNTALLTLALYLFL